MVKIETGKAIARINELKRIVGNPKKIAEAERMAMNDAARYGKTQVKRSIMEVYNFKSSRITDPDKAKGLRIKPATIGNMEAHITAGHRPANLGSFNKTRFTKRDGLTVEITKGKRKRIPSAFRLFATKGTKGASALAGAKSVAFARGYHGKPSFVFTKPRMPIAPLSSLSVGTAALNVRAQERYGPVVQAKYEQRVKHHLSRLLSKV